MHFIMSKTVVKLIGDSIWGMHTKHFPVFISSFGPEAYPPLHLPPICCVCVCWGERWKGHVGSIKCHVMFLMGFWKWKKASNENEIGLWFKRTRRCLEEYIQSYLVNKKEGEMKKHLWKDSRACLSPVKYTQVILRTSSWSSKWKVWWFHCCRLLQEAADSQYTGLTHSFQSWAITAWSLPLYTSIPIDKSDASGPTFWTGDGT